MKYALLGLNRDKVWFGNIKGSGERRELWCGAYTL